jgi:hypothetical protein
MPMEAYKQHGIVSFNYYSPAMPQQLTKYCITDALKYQSPDILLVDLGMFTIWRGLNYNEASIRHVTDNFYYSLNRFHAIEDGVLKETNKMFYHFDIAKYHTNMGNFFDKDNWYYACNKKNYDNTKSYGAYFLPTTEFTELYSSFNWPDGYKDLEEKPLPDSLNSVYYDLIEYVKKLDMNVIFTFAPYIIFEKIEIQRINYMKRIAEENGITFLNGFEFIDEMNFDAEMDFRDEVHANIIGAEKYTDWLCRYLKNHYNLPDRRGNSNYADWDLAYETWKDKFTEIKTETINQMPEELRVKVQRDV